MKENTNENFVIFVVLLFLKINEENKRENKVKKLLLYSYKFIKYEIV